MKHAFRQVRRQPSFAITVAVTLALGIGATCSIFSVLNAFVVRPLPYADADRLAMVWESNPSFGMPVPGARIQACVQNFLAWKQASTPLEELAAFADRDLTLTGDDSAERLRGFRATANLFPMLGVKPQIGRLYNPSEDTTGHDHVVLLSAAFWHRRFGSDPKVLGSQVRLEGEMYTVIGVLPEKIEEPPRWNGYQKRPDVWIPMAFSDEERTSTTKPARILFPIAKLKPGVDVVHAHAAMRELGQQLARQFPQRNEGWEINLVMLQQERVAERVQQSLLILLLAAGLVLLIACFNTGHLMLTRATLRGREFAIRAALGASRGDIVRQLLGEAAVLGVAGGALGVLVSYWATPLLLSMQSGMLRRVEDVVVDWRVLGFALVMTLSAVVAFGLAPLGLTRPERLKQGPSSRLRSFLLGGEVALAVVLLTASGLLIKSLRKMLDVDIGMRVERVLTVQIAAKDPMFFRELVPRIQALPGMERVGVASHLPMQALMGGRVRTPGMNSKDALGADFRWVDSGYFGALGIPILRGRNFSTAEVEKGDARVAIVDATLARKLRPAGDVIGMRVISVDWPYCSESCEVVGVSGAIRQIGPEEQSRPEIILPGVGKSNALVVRSYGEPGGLGPLIRREVAALDRDQPVGLMELMTTSFAGTTEERRFNVALTSTFTSLALILAGVGVFAVTAFAVSQRTREIGVRMALGARVTHVAGVVLGSCVPALMAGAGAGLLAAVWLMGSLRQYLYDVEPGDWMAYGGAAAGIVLIAGIALVVPVWRALRVDPAVALRHE